MSFLMDIWNAVHGILTTSDIMTLGIMAVIALGAGIMMQSAGSLLNTTVIALLAFALVEYALAITIGKHPAGQFAAADWQAFKVIQGLTLLAYALIFGVVIAVAHGIRSAIGR